MVSQNFILFAVSYNVNRSPVRKIPSPLFFEPGDVSTLRMTVAGLCPEISEFGSHAPIVKLSYPPVQER